MKVVFSSKSLKQLEKINIRFQEKILDVLKRFENDEKVDIKKMKGRKEGYRIRIGEYRILLDKVKEKEFLVTKIGSRENIYLIFVGF